MIDSVSKMEDELELMEDYLVKMEDDQNLLFPLN